MWNFELGRREERYLVIIAILATVAIVGALDYAKII